MHLFLGRAIRGFLMYQPIIGHGFLDHSFLMYLVVTAQWEWKTQQTFQVHAVAQPLGLITINYICLGEMEKERVVVLAY